MERDRVMESAAAAIVNKNNNNNNCSAGFRNARGYNNTPDNTILADGGTLSSSAAVGSRKCSKTDASFFKSHLLDVKKRYIWSDRETEYFIRLIIDMGMTNMLDSKRKRNSDLYSSLVAPMAAAGFNRDATQLRTKWKHLKQDYKVELLRIQTNGVANSRMSYFHLLHEVLKCKPSNANAHLCEVVLGSPPRLDVSTAVIKTEYDEHPEDEKMETADYYDVTEPQVDIIQTCDAETQTTSTLEQHVLRRLQTLEKSLSAFREEWRRDQATQRTNLNRILDDQKLLIEELFVKKRSTDRQGEYKD